MTDDEVGDRLLEMREATARKCVEIAEAEHATHPSYCDRECSALAIAAAIKKEFGLEE